MDNDLLST